METKQSRKIERLFNYGNNDRRESQYNSDLITYGGQKDRLRMNPDILLMNKMKADLEYMPDNGINSNITNQ